MPTDVRAKMEGAFGTDFSGVRIHEGPRARALGALAYTQGADIHFAPGKYQPHSQTGQALLGHELTHVVQQSQGRVGATGQVAGARVNDNPALEAEADKVGAMAARGKRVGDATLGLNAGSPPGSRSLQGSVMIQRKTEAEEVYSGWEPDPEQNEVDWGAFDSDGIARLQQDLIEYGIKPMLKSLGVEDDEIEAIAGRTGAGKVIFLSKEQFGWASYALSILGWSHELIFGADADADVPILEIARASKPNFEPSLYAGYKKAFDTNLWGDLSSSEEPRQRQAVGFIYENLVEEVFTGPRAQAMGPHKVLNNGAKGNEDLGLHLLMHETLHTMASTSWKVAAGDDFSGQGGTNVQDEAATELFARLASLKFMRQPEAPKDFKISPKVPVNGGGGGAEGQIYQPNIQEFLGGEELSLAFLEELAQKYFGGE